MLFWKRCSVSVVKVLKYCSWAFCGWLVSWSTSTLLQKPYLLRSFLAKVLMIDLVFYGLAVYAGYRNSFRNITKAQLLEGAVTRQDSGQPR